MKAYFIYDSMIGPEDLSLRDDVVLIVFAESEEVALEGASEHLHVCPDDITTKKLKYPQNAIRYAQDFRVSVIEYS